MTVRVRQVTRTTQPQEAAGIDFSPLTAGLVFAHAGTELTVRDPQFNVIGSWTTNGAESSSPVYVTTTERGTAIHVTHDYAELSTDISDSDSWTFFAIGRTTANGVAPLYSRTLIHRGRDSFGDGWSANIGVDNNGKAVALVILTSGGAAGFSATGTTTINDGAWHAVCGTYSTSTNELKIYVDGVCEATTSTTKTGLRSSTKKLSLGLAGLSSSETTDASWYGDALAFSVHNRALLPSEVASISANPWQLFEPEQIVVPVASGTTAYTLTAATASFTFTGTTTGLKADRKLATSVATFTETGNAAGLAVGRKLAATVSNFTLTGVAAVLKADRKLAPSVSPYTFTGNDTTLTYSASGNKSITADVVSFALTGSDANLTVQRKLTSSVSAFTLTGNDSTLSYQRKLPAGVGVFTLTGIDVALSTTGVETPSQQTKGGAGRAKIKKKRLKVQKRELDETLQQLIDDLTEDRNYQSSQETIEEAVEELKENILDQIQPKELTKEEITEALVVTTVSLKLTAMEVSLSEKLDKITKELEKTNRYVQSLEELVILLNNT